MAFYPLSALILEGFYPFYKGVCDAQKMKSCIECISCHSNILTGLANLLYDACGYYHTR